MYALMSGKNQKTQNVESKYLVKRVRYQEILNSGNEEDICNLPECTTKNKKRKPIGRRELKSKL